MEIVSLEMAVRTLGIPALHVWDLILDRGAGLDVMQSNDATILIMKKGQSPRDEAYVAHPRSERGVAP